MKINSYKKADGKTYYRFNVYLGIDEETGKEIRTSRSGFKTKKAAEIAYTRLRNSEDNTKAKQMRFGDIYAEWLEVYKRTVKESTLQKTTEIFRLHILPEVGHMYIDKISIKSAQAAVNTWHDNLVNFKLVKRYASRVIDYAIKTGRATSNPFNLVTYPIKVLSVEAAADAISFENFLERHDLVKLLNEANKLDNPMWHTFFRLLAYTGIRKGEALALKWSDIDFKENTLTINKTLTLGLDNKLIVQSPKTRESIRSLDVDIETMAILKDWRTSQNEILSGLGYFPLDKSQMIFTNLNNDPINLPTPGHRLNYLIKRAGVKKITVHGLRHTYCSILFAAGVSIQDVQKRLGHRDIKTTMNIYNHFTEDKRKDVAEAFLNYMSQ